MDIIIVGAGKIAREYISICIEFGYNVLVVCNTEASKEKIQKDFPNTKSFSGGLALFLVNYKGTLEKAIVATNIDNLNDSVLNLIECGIKNIFVEKPFSLDFNLLKKTVAIANSNGVGLYIAFNRRNYQSVITAKKIIEEDGGVQSFFFDFTEAVFRIDENKYSEIVMSRWGLSNSSHVIDTAFHLGGKPREINSYIQRNDIAWHPSGSVFVGSGITTENIPFSYHANWGAPGRWSIELNTSKRKLIFSPMEKLKVQNKNSFIVEDFVVDYSMDENFKPGFYLQVKAFLEQNYKNLKSGAEHVNDLWIYNKIFNYS